MVRASAAAAARPTTMPAATSRPPSPTKWATMLRLVARPWDAPSQIRDRVSGSA
jgi:hypothetical protein